jgi:hypothetical protein
MINSSSLAAEYVVWVVGPSARYAAIGDEN